MTAPLPASPPLHGTEAPSAWVQRWSHLVRAHGTVLDVACGHGRHTRWLDALGHAVTAVDRSSDAIEAIAASLTKGEAVVADIENGPWPFAHRQFDAVVVTNYLWRPLMPTLLASLAPGGVLIYETFTAGNETVGKPSRPDFLLRTGELLTVCAGLRVVAFEDGFEERGDGTGQPVLQRFVQRIAAVNEPPIDTGLPSPESPSQAVPARYQLPWGLGRMQD
ncbi:class I SAM-dependent methyltransferase [Polaromonas sp. YR568]|uniref:class I SAM-dependent methyltransferase n=1 Tax=Polaromonas sp. YR568 TaxID=1855301 RepID=UPI003137CF5D